MAISRLSSPSFAWGLFALFLGFSRKKMGETVVVAQRPYVFIPLSFFIV